MWLAKCLSVLLVTGLQGCAGEKPSGPAPVPLEITGHSGNLPVRLYKPHPPFQGLILFASGDGGWKPFEDRICRNLAANGFCVVGWDCRKYADAGVYDQQALVSDMTKAMNAGAEAASCPRSPSILAGYSTGAEQALAAASAHPRPDGLKGVLIIAPGERGRYGITTSDLIGLTPTGKGSFALTDLSPGLKGLRLFQIHGEHDPLAQTEWLKSLQIPHKLEVYPDGWHMFKGGPKDFQNLLMQGARWVFDEGG